MNFSQKGLQFIFPAFLAFVAIAPGATDAQAEELENVTSREFKIMLKADQFKGDVPGDLNAAIDQLETKLTEKITMAGLEYDGDFGDDPEDIRFVNFLDTENHDLRTNGYVLRQRGDLEYDENDAWIPKEGKTKYTLKFRHVDQYIAARKDVAINEIDYNLSKVKLKFEEDISPVIATVKAGKHSWRFTNQTVENINPENNWRSLYSFSGTGRDKDDAITMSNLNDISDLYPAFTAGIAEEGYSYDDTNAPELKVVSGLTVYERVFEGLSVDLGDGVDADFAFTAWYEMSSNYLKPVVVELSFDYKRIDDDILEETAEVGRNAKKLFESILSLDMVDISSSTKTSFVYSYND